MVWMFFPKFKAERIGPFQGVELRRMGHSAGGLTKE